MATPLKKRPSHGGSAGGAKVKRKLSHGPEDSLASPAWPASLAKIDGLDEEGLPAAAAAAPPALPPALPPPVLPLPRPPPATGPAAAAADARKDAAHRAYLAHAAPHLFEDQHPSPPSPHHDQPQAQGPGAATTTTATATASSSASSRSPSPSPSLSLSSRQPPPPPPPAAPCTRHVVPHRYRGPLPRDADAEIVAPHPTLQAAPGPGADGLYTAPNTPLNKNSWRYTFAGPDTPRLPTSVYRSIPSLPDGIRWDWSDRSAFTQISREADVVTSDRGWRAARGNVPVREGSWYCEIQILSPEMPLSDGTDTSQQGAASSTELSATSSHPHHGHAAGPSAPMKDGPHVRVGWGRREAPLNAPVGFDGYSYGLRDTTGQTVFLSRPAAFASRSFAPGDTLGLYIRLPTLSKPSPRDAKDPRHVRRKWIPIRYRGQVYFEQLDYTQTREMERLLEKSWAGDKILRPDGGLKLRRVKSPITGRMGDESGEWVEVEEGNAEGEEDGGEGPTRAGSSGAKMKKQKAVKKASSHPTPAPGGPSSKGAKRASNASSTGGGKRDGRAVAADEEKKKKRALRPLPTLGPTSRIGFFLNGQPLGWAFQDLLDFRPLRQAGAANPTTAPAAPSKKSGGGGGGGGSKTHAAEGNADVIPSQLDPASLASLSTLGLETSAVSQDANTTGSPTAAIDFVSAPLLTTSASLSTIMKSRENPYDDGCCGYFPMVSLYGGARARLKSKREEMSFLPEGGLQGVERSLERAERRRRGVEDEGADEVPPLEEKDWWGQTRPLGDLYREYWDQQRLLDLEEEERATARAKWIKTLVEEGDEDEIANAAGGGEGDSRATPTSKKKSTTSKGAGAGAGKRSFTPRDVTVTPTPDPPPPQGPIPITNPSLSPPPYLKKEEEEADLPAQKDEKEGPKAEAEADSALSPPAPASSESPSPSPSSPLPARLEHSEEVPGKNSPHPKPLESQQQNEGTKEEEEEEAERLFSTPPLPHDPPLHPPHRRD